MRNVEIVCVDILDDTLEERFGNHVHFDMSLSASLETLLEHVLW